MSGRLKYVIGCLGVLTVVLAVLSGCSDSRRYSSLEAERAPRGSVDTPDRIDVESSVLGEEVGPVGFESVSAAITTGDGVVHEFCFWLANTANARAEGLTHVSSLGRADGMALVHGAPQSSKLWMKDTLLPLEAAFFDEFGRWLDTVGMEPCSSEPCPEYGASAAYTTAVEVPNGVFSLIGVGPGSKLVLRDVACRR